MGAIPSRSASTRTDQADPSFPVWALGEHKRPTGYHLPFCAVLGEHKGDQQPPHPTLPVCALLACEALGPEGTSPEPHA